MGSQPRKALCIFLTLLTLFLLGTVVVLSTVIAYFGVDSRDVITEAEMRLFERLAEQARQTPLAGGGKQEVVTPIPDDDSSSTTIPSFSSSSTTSNDDFSEEATETWSSSSFATDLNNPELDERSSDSDISNLAARAINGTSSSGITTDTPTPRIPKIVHQTWKTDILPERWEKVRQSCMDIHPDYEYMLWTDASSREFIATHYSWFLPTFDGYPYPIQRADSIRYFVLHHYGGIYLDLDIGCRRSMDPLLYFDVILPATIPVGVSNDLMASSKEHPFMNLVINNLITFDHTYGTNYPTVMFSTGPMFLSASYGLWPKDSEALSEERQVRILPRRWYGKNAPATEMGDSYFTHYYGSSWHADDAGFITFLGKFGMVLMYAGAAVVVLGAARLLWSKRAGLKKTSPRPVGPIALPFHVPNESHRPGTPGGSRPNSPFPGGSRSSTPNRGHRRDDSTASSIAALEAGAGGQAAGSAGRGVLYYLPFWFVPNSGADGSPSPAQGGSWASYLPGFVDSSDSHGYHPVPDFSRPPSPSNNSILHAPGAQHDGAFDGVHLHSIQPSSSSPASPRSPSFVPPTSPPAYSTIKTWGTTLFRNSPFAKASSGVLPTVSPAANAAHAASSNPSAFPSSSSTTASEQHPHHHHARSFSRPSNSGHARTSSRAESPRPHARPRSPLPVYPAPTSSTAPSPTSASSHAVATSSAVIGPGHHHLHHPAGGESRPTAAGMVRTGSGGAGVSSPYAPTSSGDDASDLEGSEGGEYESADGRGVEEEVDRLLSEMAPSEFRTKDQ